MRWNTGLSGPALRIAKSDDSSLRVMAGPGTGKSFAMQRRVARLLEEGADPRRILAVTFTRNAAANLLLDLRNLGISGCENIWAGTLHAFCYQLLKKQNVFQYLGRVPRPLITFNKSGVLQFECQPLLEDICRAGLFGGKRDCTKRIRAFEAAWARLQHENPGWPTNPVDSQFQEVLLSWLQFHQAILIGELVPEALRFLRNNPGAPELSAFDHVVVDEYQDLNKAEQVLLDYLARNSRLSIVGDIDQSIYSFRFANPDGIVEFKQRHPQTHDEPLVECRRCPKRVIAIADYLIRHNHPPTTGVRLNTFPTNPDGEVYIVQWDSLQAEAEGLARFICHLVNDRRYGPGDILVLTPRRLLGYGIRDALTRLNVPVHSFYYEEALETEESQTAFTLLTLLVNPEDRVALRFWLGLGSPSWNASEYARLRRHCEVSGLSPSDVLEQITTGQPSMPRTTTIVARYKDLISQLDDLRSLACKELVKHLFPDGTDWARPMREIAVRILGSVSTPAELFGELKVQITQPEMPEEGNFVRVMSLHKSKGLTSKVTIVTGCIQGLIPTTDSDHTPEESEENLREQRRLFYVALTRCKEILVLSSVTHLPRNIAHKIGANVIGRGSLCRTIASQFMTELGPEAPFAVRGVDWVKEGFVCATTSNLSSSSNQPLK